MAEIGTVSGLFVLFYLLPGSIILSSSFGDKERRLENAAMAVLLSLVFAPLTVSQLSLVFSGRELIAGYVAVWVVAFLAVRLFSRSVQVRLPDSGALPKADKGALLLAALLAAAVVSLRIGIFQGYESLIGDDHFHLTKLTSIAATGLPAFYARQPLFAFSYYDLDYVIPALLVRFSGGAVGIATAWVVHIGVQTLVISIFLSRLLYMYVRTRFSRLFGLLALHLGTGLDLIFLPLIEGLTHLDAWPVNLMWFDGFMQISMPFSLYLWVPQHLLGMALVGLIGYLTVARPLRGYAQAVATALLTAALFKTSIFVFAGTVPGLVIWHLYELLTGKGRIRHLLHLSTAAMIACVLIFPSLIELLSKSSYLQFGMRSIVFLDKLWLKYPLTALSYLSLEIGILLPMLLWAWIHPHLLTRSHRFWLCLTVSFLLPFVVRSPFYNDIAMRGAMPAQLAAVMVACIVLVLWERTNRRLSITLVSIQLALTVFTVGTEFFLRFTSREPVTIPQTSRWIARNVPPNALVFYEQNPEQNSEKAMLTESTHGQRMSYSHFPTIHDYLYTETPPDSWRCLPVVNLYDATSLCSIADYVPGGPPIFVVYRSSSPVMGDTSFVREYDSADGSIYSLSCPFGYPPETQNPPAWKTDCEIGRWTFSEQLDPLKVQYDGGISLQEIVAHPAGGGGVVLQWETAPKIDTVFALSFRLYNTEDEQVYQQDTVIWNQITGNTKSRGHPSPFRTLVLFDFVNAAPYLQYNQTIPLDFPEDLSSGNYELRLIVYDAATLQQTVELGTWKPEILLARLQHERDPLNGN